MAGMFGGIFERGFTVQRVESQPHVKNPGHDNLRNLSMLEIFRVETESQTGILTSGLLEVEKVSRAGGEVPAPSQLAAQLESLMRAAHSLGMKTSATMMYGSVERIEQKLRLLEGREVKLGDDERILDGHVPRGPHPDLAEQAHGVVGRRGVPIDPTDRRLANLRREDLDGQDILLGLVDD